MLSEWVRVSVFHNISAVARAMRVESIGRNAIEVFRNDFLAVSLEKRDIDYKK